MTVSIRRGCDWSNRKEENVKITYVGVPVASFLQEDSFLDCSLYVNFLPCALLKNDSTVRSSLTVGI